MSNIDQIKNEISAHDLKMAEARGALLALEQSIASTEKTLVDLDKGVGAPNTVPAWLGQKASLSAKLAADRDALAALQTRMEAVERVRPELAEQVERGCVQAVVQEVNKEVGELEAALAAASRYAERYQGARLYLLAEAEAHGGSGHPLAQPYYRILEGLKAAPEGVDGLNVTNAGINAARVAWKTRAAALQAAKG